MGKPRQNLLSADAPLHQARTGRFCTDSKGDANRVTSSVEEQANVEPNISGVKRAKNKHGCLKDTSMKSTSTDSHAI